MNIDNDFRILAEKSAPTPGPNINPFILFALQCHSDWVEDGPPNAPNEEPHESLSFLSAIAPGEDCFTFQTFNDDEYRKRNHKSRDALATIMHGTLAEHWERLVWLSRRGAGVFVTINRTDLSGREKANVVAVRALFVDLDGTPLENVNRIGLEPTIVVETSAGRFHAYWRVEGILLGDFTILQKRLNSLMSSDRNVQDLPRVMRLPGFPHQKDPANPQRVRICSNAGASYEIGAFRAALDIAETRYGGTTTHGDRRVSRRNEQLIDFDELESAVLSLPIKEFCGEHYTDWIKIGMAIHYETGGDERGLELFNRWSSGDPQKYSSVAVRNKWNTFKDDQNDPVTGATIRYYAREFGWKGLRNAVTLADFFSYMKKHLFIFAATGDMWPAASVDQRLASISAGKKQLKASVWLSRNRAVEQITWAPGLPMLIENRLILDGGWIERDGCRVFNLYRPPTIGSGEGSRAGPWLDHVRRIYPDDADHIIKWLAHRVQRPGEKVNHALVLGGMQGIGKDTLLDPVRHAIGPWNFADVSPTQAMGRFNKFLKSVVLCISEARDLGEFDRYAFYDHTKSYIAAPPDVNYVDEKNTGEYYIPNVCGVVITTNHKTTGIHLDRDDRRHFVAWSDCTKDDFDQSYWDKLWRYYDDGGRRHVATYLADLDLHGWNAKASPRKTDAFWAIVDAGQAPEDAELMGVIEGLGAPEAVTLFDIGSAAINSEMIGFAEWLEDRRNSRLVPHRMEACGYVAVRNDDSKNRKWKVLGKHLTIYAKQCLAPLQRIHAARALAEQKRTGQGG